MGPERLRTSVRAIDGKVSACPHSVSPTTQGTQGIDHRSTPLEPRPRISSANTRPRKNLFGAIGDPSALLSFGAIGDPSALLSKRSAQAFFEKTPSRKKRELSKQRPRRRIPDTRRYGRVGNAGYPLALLSYGEGRRQP